MDDIGAIQLAVKVDYTQLTGLMKTTGQTKRAVGLLAKDFARTKDLSKYMSGINQIVTANKKLGNSAGMSRKQIMRLGAKVQQETRFTDALTAATTRLTVAQMNSNKVLGNTKNKMNGNNMAIQQLGYQFGDFAVQVQGGTSAFVAFSQQGSQLAGILPMIAGPLGLSMGAAVGLSAALGILIPIGSAVGRMFFEMGGKAKSAKNKVEELIEALNGLESLSFNNSLSGVQAIEDKWSNTLKLVREYYATIAEDNKTALFESAGVLVKDLDTIAGKIQALEFQKASQGGLLDVSGTQELIDYNEEYDKLKRTKEILVGLDTSSKKNLSDSFRVIVDSLTTEGLLTKELTTQLALFAEQANISSVINEEKKNASENQISSIQHFYKFQAEEEAKALESKKRVAKIVQDLKDKAAEKEKALNISIVKNRIDGVNAYYTYEEKMAKEKAARDKLVAEIQEKERLRLVDLGVKASGTQGRGGAIAPTKGQVAEMGMGPQITDAQSKLEAQEKLNKKQDEYLATLSLTTQEQLVTAGLKDRELLVAKQFNEKYRVQLELEKLGLEYGSAKYERALETLKTQQESILYVYDRIEAEKKLTEEKEKQGQLIDTIGGIIGDGFISMVEGTESVKDAFKNMARAIIKELYQILVVQQMVNAAKTAMGIPFADGGVFSGGSQVQAYANGGVVGSPTTFPMSGGKTGLMGEAGPEAIMPLKRGANGKLGVQMEGGATTTVVQNFNFSANGDDSVKKLIAQAAPKIAQMTKSEMLNDRRRGGTMKATFG